jgi:hypothetical protein
MKKYYKEQLMSDKIKQSDNPMEMQDHCRRQVVSPAILTGSAGSVSQGDLGVVSMFFAISSWYRPR